MNTLKVEKRSMEIKPKRLRREGYVTGNLFGKKIEGSIPLQITKAEVTRLLKTDHKGSQIMLDVEGESYNALIKEVEYNSQTGNYDEIDFQALVSDEKVHSTAAVVILGHDKIVEGVFQQKLEEIAYKALPASITDRVEVDVTEMKVGDDIKVKDLAIAKDAGIELITDPEAVVVAITAAHAEEEAPAEGTAAETAEAPAEA